MKFSKTAMKLTTSFMLFFGLFLLGNPSLQAQMLDYPPNEFLVKFTSEAKTSFKQDFSRQLQVRKAKSIDNINAEHWQLNFPVTLENKTYYSLDEILPYLNMLPEIAYAEPNYRIYLTSTIPDDPGFGELWSCNNIGQTNGLSNADIDAPQAWFVRNSSADVKVAILDTGIDWTHPDLIDNIWQNLGEDADGDGQVIEWSNNQSRWIFDPGDINGVDDDSSGYTDDFIGWDFINNDNDPMDGHGHGTHVAGTIGAKGNNGIGITGVTWEVQLMGLKIFGDSTEYVGVNAVIQALAYTQKMGVQLSSNSWGGYTYSQALYDAIESLDASGDLFVAAAGNDANNNDYAPFYPASYNLDNILAVAATDHNDQFSPYSNYGVLAVDLAAPGSGIYSTFPNGQYGHLSGTSMAAPHVSGALALLIAEFPAKDYLTIKNDLLAAVDYKNSLNNKCLTVGRLNIGNALNTSVAEDPLSVYTCKRNHLSGNFNVQYPQPNTIYEWDFGDGITATGENVLYSYATEGIYQACLTATNSFGSDTTCYWMGVTDSNACLMADSLGLVAFYHQTDGDNWTNGWDFSMPVDTWYGVTVDGCGVTNLDLSNNQLNGQVPDFSGMDNLASLNLGTNQLGGAIPDFTNMANLTGLYLSGNKLSGMIPDFSGMGNLTGLYLSSNELGGTIPDFSCMKNLGYLNLYDNQLSGTIPDFTGLNNLTYLYLYNNELSGTIPDFSGMNKLTWLNLSNNQLSGTIPDFSSINNLNYLYLNRNQLSGTIPSFSGINKLATLWLNDNQLDGTIPDFTGLNNLTTLRLNDNQLSGAVPDFSNINNLAYFYLSGNNFLFGDIDLNLNNNNANITYFYYAQQDSIPIAINFGDSLSVTAGGTMGDNIYHWYKNNAPITTIPDNNKYSPSTEGYYKCRVENAHVTRQQSGQDLYLWSETIYYDGNNFCTTGGAFSYPNQPCTGSTMTFTNTSVDASSYLWLVNGDTLSTDTDFTYAFPSAGDYVVTLIANSNTCTGTHTEIISISPEVSELNISEEVAFCESGTLDAGVSGLSYNWEFQNTMIGVGQTLSVGQSGTYHLTVTDACVNTATATINVTVYNDCVWPGDFNRDGQVNYKDILALGFAYGKTGPSRPSPSMDWGIQASNDWLTASYKNINDKNCDGNGDGVVDEDDLAAIDLNYGKTHNAGINFSNTIQGRPYKLKPSFEHDEIKVKLAHENGGPASLYGLDFKVLGIPRDAQVKFDSSEFQGILFKKERSRNVDIAMTGTNGFNRDIEGTVCSITSQDLPTGRFFFSIGESEATLDNGYQVGVQGALMGLFLGTNGNNGPANGGGQGDIELFIYATPYACDEPSEAEVTVITGTSPFSYQWDNGTTNSQTTGLSSGYHFVTITDALGKTRVGYIDVGQDKNFQVNLATTDTYNGQSSGTATVSIVGSDSTATYLWSDGQTTVTATGLIKGNYSVTVTSAQGCQEIRHFGIEGDRVLVQVKAYLEGAYDIVEGQMHDNLRTNHYLPTDGLPANNDLSTVGDNAIVDWVKVELRDAASPTEIIAVQAALIQRDGDVVMLDGVSALRFENLPINFYHVVLVHRNHLAVMTKEPVLLSKTLGGVVDFRNGIAYGQNAMIEKNGQYMLIAGETDGDGYIDSSDRGNIWNDRQQFGYLQTDCNLDGYVDFSDRIIGNNNKLKLTNVP